LVSSAQTAILTFDLLVLSQVITDDQGAASVMSMPSTFQHASSDLVGTVSNMSSLAGTSNDILFTNRLTAPPSATAPPAILSSRDRSIAGYS